MDTFETERVSTYQQEDIQEILQIAIARQAYQGEFSRSQLLEIAEELAIPPDCLQAAEQEWHEQQSEQRQRQVFNDYRRQKFYHKLGKYLIVNGFFLTIDFLSGGTLSWSRYIFLCSGFWMSLNAWSAFQQRGEAYEKAFRSWERQRHFSNSARLLLKKVQRVLQ